MKKIVKNLTIAIIIGLTTGILLLICTQVAIADNIEDLDKWAWGTNIGWINFDPTHDGVTVYEDHLEGFAWGENVGWIKLGTYSGGDAHTYLNTTAENYGVNRDIHGNLSGYAWGTNIGWINFNPTHGGVTIDPSTGTFDGFAWGENIGWIHFKGGSGGTAYSVITAFRAFLAFLPIIINGS